MKNEDGITDFTENYMEQLFYFCLKKTGNETEAQDLTQDIALNILIALEKGTIPTSFSAWVWRIARNRYCTWADRKRKRNDSVVDIDVGDCSELSDERSNPSEELLYKENIALLRRELAFIRRDYCEIVVAYYIEDRSVRDIARSLSLSESAVQQRLHRARSLLKEGMDMAREFGKLSYKPENISFIMNGITGGNGEPWSFLNRLLCKNIMLAAYRTPATAEELAVEIGVALPYMEEELNDLVEATLMRKNGKKYETNFFLVSAQAQVKIQAHLRGLIPELARAIVETVECETTLKNKLCPRWHEGYQPYEDMKWALLMDQVDLVSRDVIETADRERTKKPSVNKGKWGHTLRPNGGEWDVLGLESFPGERPGFVGEHGCCTRPEDKSLPYIDFRQFKFQYHGIANKTPSALPYGYAKVLVAVSEGEGNLADQRILDRLAEYGYLKEENGIYRPTFLVMFEDKTTLPPEAEKKIDALRNKAAEIAARHYRFCREQIEREIPDFLKKDAYQIDHACVNIFLLRGAVLEEALRQGYIKYDENDERKMLGAELRI